jgi:HPt (histidine-containing phosphotransfer) domain-containing protein
MTDLDRVPLVDLEVVADLRAATGDDDEFLADLISTYIAEGTDHLDAMVAALAGGDAGALVRPAHTLKSSSASVGAMRLSEVARGIEVAARDGHDIDLADDVAAARRTWSETVEALRAAGLA